MPRPTKTLCWMILLSLCTGSAWADDALVGTWAGLIEVDPGKVEIEFQIFVESMEKGEIWFPTQGTKRQPLIGIQLKGDQIKFSTIDSQGIIASFEGELSSKAIRGKLSEQDLVRPFHLKRTPTRPDATLPAGPDLTVLGPEATILRQAFNADQGKVRMVAILSPTCGVCRMGARMVENYLFDRFDDPRLQVYVVWEPQLEDDSEATAREATFFLDSERASHYWSHERYTGQAFQNHFELDGPAWDVFMVFGADTTWNEAAPKAEFYMHNLRSQLPAEHLLDAEVLARRVDKLLAQEWARGP